MYSDTIATMSRQQRELRLKIKNTNNPLKIQQLKSERNKIIKEIKQEIRKMNEDMIDNITDQINKSNNGVQFFKAIKHLR